MKGSKERRKFISSVVNLIAWGFVQSGGSKDRTFDMFRTMSRHVVLNMWQVGHVSICPDIMIMLMMNDTTTHGRCKKTH